MTGILTKIILGIYKILCPSQQEPPKRVQQSVAPRVMTEPASFPVVVAVSEPVLSVQEPVVEPTPEPPTKEEPVPPATEPEPMVTKKPKAKRKVPKKKSSKTRK